MRGILLTDGLSDSEQEPRCVALAGESLFSTASCTVHYTAPVKML